MSTQANAARELRELARERNRRNMEAKDIQLPAPKEPAEPSTLPPSAPPAAPASPSTSSSTTASPATAAAAPAATAAAPPATAKTVTSTATPLATAPFPEGAIVWKPNAKKPKGEHVTQVAFWSVRRYDAADRAAKELFRKTKVYADASDICSALLEFYFSDAPEHVRTWVENAIVTRNRKPRSAPGADK